MKFQVGDLVYYMHPAHRVKDYGIVVKISKHDMIIFWLQNSSQLLYDLQGSLYLYKAGQ